MDDQAEAWTRARCDVAEHLVIAVGVAERRDRPAAQELADADRLAGLVVDEVDFVQSYEHGLIVAQLVPGADRAADDVLGRDAVNGLGPGPEELDASPRDDAGLEALRSQVGQQLQHRLVDAVRPTGTPNNSVTLLPRAMRPVTHGGRTTG